MIPKSVTPTAPSYIDSSWRYILMTSYGGSATVPRRIRQRSPSWVCPATAPYTPIPHIRSSYRSHTDQGTAREWEGSGGNLKSLVHTKLVCNTSLHVPAEIAERVKTGNFDQMFCIIRYQYVSKQFSVRRPRFYSVRGPLVSSSDRVKSPVHLVGTTFPNSPSPSAVRWNPFRPSCTSFPLRPIPF